MQYLLLRLRKKQVCLWDDTQQIAKLIQTRELGYCLEPSDHPVFAMCRVNAG